MRFFTAGCLVLVVFGCGGLPQTSIDAGAAGGGSTFDFGGGAAGGAAGGTSGGGSAGGGTTDAGAGASFGARCSAGCLGSSSRCAVSSTTCASGTCLFDVSEAYCTVDCSSTACPAGAECRDVTGVLTRACVALPAVCGNGVVERGETCDDGNQLSNDGCRADCRALDTPASAQHRAGFSLRVRGSYRFDGGAEVTLDDLVTTEAQVAAGGAVCSSARGITPSGSNFRRYAIAGCTPDAGTNRRLELTLTVPAGQLELPPGRMPDLCLTLTLPDRSLPGTQFCAPAAQPTFASPDGGADSFRATIATTPLEWRTTALCTGRCPTEFPVPLTIEGTVDVKNQPR